MRWLRLSAAAWLLPGAGYAATGLFGVGDSLALLGRPSAVSLALAACSLLAPAAAIAALVSLRRSGPPLQWTATLLLLGLGALCWSHGGLPLRTWQ